LLKGKNQIGIRTSFEGAAPLWRASSSVSNSAEFDEAKGFLLQPSWQTNGMPRWRT